MANEQRPSLARLKGHVVETGQAVHIEAPRKRKRVKGWRDHVNLVDIGVMNKLEMIGLEYRVLFAMLRFIPEKGGNQARVTQEELADVARTDQPQVSRIIKEFRARNLVRDVRRGVYDVNPHIAFSGDFDSWNAEAEQWPEPIWLRGVDPSTGEVE